MSICPYENLLWGMAWSSWTLSSNVQSYELSLVCYLRCLVRRAWPAENRRIVNRTRTFKEQVEGLSQCNLEDRLGNVEWTVWCSLWTPRAMGWRKSSSTVNPCWRRQDRTKDIGRALTLTHSGGENLVKVKSLVEFVKKEVCDYKK